MKPGPWRGREGLETSSRRRGGWGMSWRCTRPIGQTGRDVRGILKKVGVSPWNPGRRPGLSFRSPDRCSSPRRRSSHRHHRRRGFRTDRLRRPVRSRIPGRSRTRRSTRCPGCPAPGCCFPARCRRSFRRCRCHGRCRSASRGGTCACRRCDASPTSCCPTMSNRPLVRSHRWSHQRPTRPVLLGGATAARTTPDACGAPGRPGRER